MTTVGRNFAFLTCPDIKGLTHDDLHLANELDKLGIAWQAVDWSNPHALDFSHLCIRSTWDYSDNIDDFKAFIHACNKKNIVLFNPREVVLSNLNKKYLFELEKNFKIALPDISQLLTHKNREQTLKSNLPEKMVLKPCISAAGKNTFIVDRKHLERIDLGNKEWLLQTFIPEIFEGELSLIWIKDRFNHAVLKIPKKGEFRVQQDHGGEVKAVKEIPPAALLEAQKLIPYLKPLLFGRVDLCRQHGKWVLMELELIEPELFLRFSPEGARLLAHALKNYLT